MSKYFSYALTLASTLVFTLLSACATGQPPVVERLDEVTAATIAYNRTVTFIMSSDSVFDRATQETYVQTGLIEVNQAGTFHYYLWLGITDSSVVTYEGEGPEEYASIVLVIDGEKLQLDVRGWAAEAIGASERVYKKLYRDTIDAYYPVNLDHIQLLADAGSLELHTTGSASKILVPWDSPSEAAAVFTEFINAVRH